MKWQPTASLGTLRTRAQLLAAIRGFFVDRQVLEVTTPVLSASGTTDINIHSITATSVLPGKSEGYLHTSPEFAMKRLLAAGSGAIFQICPVFRDSDCGRHHRPEFTLLEWYRPGFDYRRLMEEVAVLVDTLAADYRKPDSVHYKSYRSLFCDVLKLDPAKATADDCRKCCEQQGLAPPPMNDDLDPWLDLLMSALIAPRLPVNTLTFVYDYPASQAALAKIKHDGDGYSVAERFELYWGALELANGFQELTDADEQLLRFQTDNMQRQLRGLPCVPVDEKFIDALRAGLPECAGVALGVDRLLMALLGVNDIKHVLAFADEF